MRALKQHEEPVAPYCSNWLEVAQSLGEVKPQVLVKVPRVEKITQKLEKIQSFEEEEEN